MYRRLYGEELFQLLRPNAATTKGEAIKAQCEAHPEWTLVCEEAGRIVGFITFFIDTEKGIGEIGNNAVDLDGGLKGLGQQMYKAVLDRFRQQGLRFARVSTGLDEAHARARRAYERAGFNIHEEGATYYMEL